MDVDYIVVTEVVTECLAGSPERRTFLATGILGGLTTFSVFSLDMMHLLTDENGGLIRCLVDVLVSVTAAFAALIAGICLMRSVLA